jgi:Ca2+-binding RTX toxin-like protein
MAGGGPSILVGGDGNDLLYGGSARDVLIGGEGRDQLWGRGGSDLLIAGATTYDTDELALAAILSEWSSSRAFRVRITNLRAGVGPLLSGTGIHLESRATVLNDAQVDSLMASGDADWIFAGPRDRRIDKAEQLN